jgi:hypothetical protein
VDSDVPEALLIAVSGAIMTAYHGTGLLVIVSGWSCLPRWAQEAMGGPFPIVGLIRRIISATYLSFMTFVGLVVLVVAPFIQSARTPLSVAAWFIFGVAWVVTGAFFVVLGRRYAAKPPVSDRQA